MSRPSRIRKTIVSKPSALLSVPKVRYLGKHLLQQGESPMTSAVNSDTDQLGILGDRLRQRLEPGRGERPGRPSDPSWTVQRKLSMSEQTLRILALAADAVSTDRKSVV